MRARSFPAPGALRELAAHVLAHEVLLHLAGGGDRKTVHEPDVTRDFEMSDPTAAESADIFLGELCTGA
jgi:hypothetical protein